MAVSSFSNSGIRSGVKRNKFWDQSAVENSFFSIATQTVSAGGSGSIEFTNIPQNYTHLQIRGIVQTNRTSYVVDVVKMQFNNDTSTNYSGHRLKGGYSTSPAATGTGGFNDSSISLGDLNSSVSANAFSVIVVDILDYTNTNKFKTVKGITGFDINGTAGTDSYGGTVQILGGNWRSTNAITSIKITPNTGTAFNQYSSLALYGIKG